VITNRDAAAFTSDVARHRQERGIRLWFEWRGFRIGAAEVEARVTASVTLAPGAPAAHFEAEIELPDHLSVRSFTFPCLCAVGASDVLTDESLFLPISGGVLIDSPRSVLAAGGTAGSWQVNYPGPAAMQLLGYSCGRRTTAWIAGLDSSGARKMLSASGLPGSDRLTLSIAHYPSLQPDGHWSIGYPTAIGVAPGDWFEAAREYRAWVARQPWCSRGRGGERRVPALTSSHGLWASYWGGPRELVGVVHELQRFVNLPVKLDWRCWHGCTRDGAYPDYFPVRDGDDVFDRVKRRLDEAGVIAQFSLNGLLASSESLTWEQDEAGRYALRPPGDSQRMAGVRPPLAPMCPSTHYWQGKLAALAREAMLRGADGIYIEDLCGCEPGICEDPDHSHIPAGRTSWAAAVRAALATVRAGAGTGRHLAVGGPVEAYIDIVDAFLTDHPAAERAGTIPEQVAARSVPIPLFSAVYHDYTTLIGPAVSLVNTRPHDPLWPRDVIADLRAPPDVLRGDYQEQFCLEVARAVTWGHHPVLDGFTPGHTRDDANRHKMAFLAAAIRASAWGVGALLPFSEFMGPLAVDSSSLTIHMLINPPRSSVAERRSIHRAIRPVLGSAWRTPGGGLALVIANMAERDQDFAARLSSRRLGAQLPLRMAGRVFSEDGDVPAPSLLASGSEISGKLAARSVLLVSLR
jgi:hypothetical protein